MLLLLRIADNICIMVILITGASSGIGYEAAKMLAAKGHKVYAAARRTELLEPLKADGIVPVKLDVTDETSCQDCVRTVSEAEGRIDALVNNAGYGYLGPIECVPLQDAHTQIRTNLLGMACLCKLVIPFMREQKSGRIVNISSVAGQAPVLFGGWYNISKYGVEALSDNLRIELKPFGIKVIKIEPGGIKTPWGGIAADHLEECTSGTVAVPFRDARTAVKSSSTRPRPTPTGRLPAVSWVQWYPLPTTILPPSSTMSTRVPYPARPPMMH